MREALATSVGASSTGVPTPSSSSSSSLSSSSSSSSSKGAGAAAGGGVPAVLRRIWTKKGVELHAIEAVVAAAPPDDALDVVIVGEGAKFSDTMNYCY